MAEEKQTEELVMDSMPGADPISEKDAEPTRVDLNFMDEETEEEDEVEFPTEEVVEEETEAEAEVVEEDEKPNSEDKAEAEVPEEAEAEATEEEAALSEAIEEAEVEEPTKPKAPMVPKSRLDEVLQKNKAMQKKIEDIEQKEAESQAEAPTYDFNNKEQEYQQFILDGEQEKAVQLRQEMRDAEKELFKFEIRQEMGQTVQRSREEQELSVKAQEIEATFSVLNENSEDFNKDLAEEVRDLRDAFMVQGYTAADSLTKATEYTLAAKMPELLQGQETNSENVTKMKTLTEKKQKTTVKKKLAAAKAQPPELKGEGTSKRGDSATDIDILSDDEFGALPEETLKRLRGDFG